MAPMFPWTDCHKLILANRNPWQNRTLNVLSFPKLSNTEKPEELNNMNAMFLNMFIALTSSARELHRHLPCVCDCITCITWD